MSDTPNFKEFFKEFFLESPQFVGPTDFGLSNTKINQETLIKELRRRKEILIDNPEYQVFTTGDKGNGKIILYDKESMRIYYYVRYEMNRTKFISGTVTQVNLWRNYRYPASRGMADYIVFEYFLKRYNSIVSDMLQTQRGKDFWIDLMGRATLKNYKVGMTNLDTRSIDWFNPKTQNFTKWIEGKDEAWGPARSNQKYRFIISN